MDNNKTRYYNTLCVSPTANREEIAAAYRKLALVHHPLRNPRENEAQSYLKFTKLCEAYQVLSDPLMKRVYDKYGEYSLKNGVPKGQDKFAGYTNQGDHYKVFESFFGCANPFIQSPTSDAAYQAELARINTENREEDIVVTLECELYEFYNGAIKEVMLARKQMLSTTQGSVVNSDRFDVTVHPGFSCDTILVHEGRGHESFGAHPSNLVIKFSQKPLANFERKGDDLVYTHTLSLVEALQMQPVAVDTLDNRKVFVAPTDVITPQTELRVVGEGMPRALTGEIVADTTTQLSVEADRPRGDLIVKFNIVFPKRVQHENRQEIIEALRANNC